MTGAESEAFKVEIDTCCNVGFCSVAARVTVYVEFNMCRECRVEDELRVISSNGDQSATGTALERARRAVPRYKRNHAIATAAYAA